MNPGRSVGSRALALGLFCAGLALAPGAFAETNRPWDAPVLSTSRATTPPPPPGYLEHREAGFTFAYHPSAHGRVREAIPVVLRVRTQMSRELGRDVLSALEIRVAAVPDEMRTLGPTEDVPHYAPALAFSEHKLVVATLGSPRALEQTDLASALAHALAHVALDEALDGKYAPVWLHEGYAAHVAGEESAARAQMLVMATLQQRLFGIAEIGARFPMDAPETSLAYAQAADLTRFLSDKPRQVAFAATFERVRAGEDFDRALVNAYGTSLPALERAWHRDFGRRYGFLPVFLVGVALWALCGVVIFLRRLWEKRRVLSDKLARETQPPGVDGERESVLEEVVSRAARMPVRVRGESTGNAIPPEAEVPKVEHEGDWHTLH